MPFTKAMTANNLLLAALPRKDREQLLAHCEQVELLFAEELYHAGDRIQNVYFPTGSIITLMTPIDDGAHLEVGLIGNEGMLSASLSYWKLIAHPSM